MVWFIWHTESYTIIQKFDVSMIFSKEVNTYWGCIKLFKTDSKDSYYISKYFYFE